ncbi:OmpH family outer membrane protein [Chlorobium sp. N1]|uniref:OmpH family outer membrane protein n=1 Tax=Chlorobium sp. N1 TaxID=2491138 RepID=UPI001F60F80B|nr:OmpH family outer membrane protein [Chlorobium sp. N1]
MRDILSACRRTALAAIFGLAIAAPSLQAAPAGAGKVGVVDFPRILQQMPEAKQAEATLKATAAPFEKELQRQQAELQKAAEAYGAERAAMSKQARDLKEKDLNLKAQGMQKYKQEKFGQGGALDQKQQQLIVPIRQKLLTAIKTIADREGYSLVLDKQAMVYGTPESDLTFKVMNQLNIK